MSTNKDAKGLWFVKHFRADFFATVSRLEVFRELVFTAALSRSHVVEFTDVKKFPTWEGPVLRYSKHVG